MIYLLYGYDSNLIKRKTIDLIKELKIDNIIKYDMVESELIDIFNEVNYIDLFNDTKVVVVSNFSLKKITKDDENIILKYIDNRNDNIIIFKCIDETLDERKNITKKLKENTTVLYFPKLEYKALEDYSYEYLKRNGYKIDYSSVKKIVNLCGNNSDFVYGELDKLMLYKIDDKVITDEDVNEVVSKNYEKEVFTFLDGVMLNDKSTIFNSYMNLINMNIDPSYILDRISNQYRLLYQVKVLSEVENNFNIANKLGVKPFIINKLLGYINNYKEEDIFDIIDKLFDCEIYIKVDGLDRFKVLENFLINI